MAEPLRSNRDFRLLWLSGLFAVLGSQMSAIALPLLILKETGSAVQAGAVGTVAVCAVLITMLPGGVMADRVERRRLMRLCDAGGWRPSPPWPSPCGTGTPRWPSSCWSRPPAPC